MEFTQQELIRVSEQTTKMKKFFTNFFPERHTHTVEKLEVHVKKGKKKLAPFVAPKQGGKILTREGFKTFNITTPKLAPSRIMTIEDISQRAFGEKIHSRKTPQERAVELFSKDYIELEESIVNRIEWMARRIMLGLSIDIEDVEAGVDINVDFNFTNSETLVSGAKWDEDTSDPLEDVKEWRRTVIRKSGVSSNICILGGNAYKAFINNPIVKERLNIKNIDIGEIKPTIIDEAVTLVAKIEGIEYYTYDEWFLDDDGLEQPMMPLDTIILTAKKIGSIEFGSVTLMDRNEKYQTYESEIVPTIYADIKNSTKELTLISRPLTVPFDVDSWYVAKVID
ncbi:MAG: major capsid protein [Bacilli bacterium]